MSFSLDPIIISGKEVLPIIEGGKGIGVSSGISSGAFAAAGAIGTFSGVNADFYDENGNVVPVEYKGKTRIERHFELIQNGIRGGICQAKIARDISGGKGAVHINVLWEMGGVLEILNGILDGARGLIDGVTCGAGMPYKIAEIASHYNIYYYPIVSSMRAFRALWKRSFHKFVEKLGGVVYEDPWKAGGHNGLSNSENPNLFEDPYPRVAEIRSFMNEVGLEHVPIIMAGGVWHLNDWKDWFNNDEIGKIAFQFGTRPILTKESPVPEEWKKRLMTLKEGDVLLNRFSPTGFYSSAVKNNFINELSAREARQIHFYEEQVSGDLVPFVYNSRGRTIFVTPENLEKAKLFISQGFDELMKTPDSTAIFVTKEKAREIINDQIACMGCLSACRFSNWTDNDETQYTTNKKPDPRSFCIQKTLQDIVHKGRIEDQLMFSGHNAFKFKDDPFYSNGFIPTVKELVDRIKIGL